MLRKKHLLLLIVTSILKANLVVNTPGCYLLQGQVESFKDNFLELKIFPESDSEELLEVKLNKPPALLAKGILIELVGYTKSSKAGISTDPILAQAESLKVISKKDFSPLRVGIWKGEAKENLCPLK